MENMTHKEILAKAKEVFGDEARVEFVDYQWVIHTGVDEKFDIEEFKGTPAYEAYHKYEGTYGSVLERWGAKNSYYSRSVSETCEAYNAAIEASWKDEVSRVRAWVADGREFNWPGGPEYRDDVLKMAEENGW